MIPGKTFPERRTAQALIERTTVFYICDESAAQIKTVRDRMRRSDAWTLKPDAIRDLAEKLTRALETLVPTKEGSQP